MLSKKVLCGLMSISLLAGCAAKNNQKPSNDEQKIEQVADQAKENQEQQNEEMNAKKIKAVEEFNKFASKNVVYFAFDSDKVDGSVILDKYKNQINNLNDFDGIVLTINGYCDNRGSVEYNNVLGMKRANAVKNVISKITDKDIDVKTISFGKNKYKVYTNDLKRNYQENRKVELVASANEDVNE